MCIFMNVSMENKVPYFWFELFCLLAWVFGWGGVEVLTIELVQIVIEIKKLKRLTNAHISFAYEITKPSTNTDKNIVQNNINDNTELAKEQI